MIFFSGLKVILIQSYIMKCLLVVMLLFIFKRHE